MNMLIEVKVLKYVRDKINIVAVEEFEIQGERYKLKNPLPIEKLFTMCVQKKDGNYLCLKNDIETILHYIKIGML